MKGLRGGSDGGVSEAVPLAWAGECGTSCVVPVTAAMASAASLYRRNLKMKAHFESNSTYLCFVPRAYTRPRFQLNVSTFRGIR